MKKKSKRRLLRRYGLSALQWILLSVIPARMAAIAFVGDQPSGWFISAVGALLLGIAFARFFYLREEQVLLLQYLHLLGFLSTRLSAGIPLEAAFIESVEPLAEQLGRHNLIVRSLVKLKKNLDAQMSLNEALFLFMSEVNLPVCRRDFTMLIMLSRTGGRIDIFIRQSHLDLSAQINTQSEVTHERRGQSSEAVILALTPFLMARFILGSASAYGGSLQDEHAMGLPLSILYLVAIVALFILIYLLAPEKTTAKTKLKKRSPGRSEKPVKETALSLWLSRLYLDWLPGQIGMSVSSAVQQLAPEREESWKHYMGNKTRDIYFGLLLAVMLAVSGRVSWFLVILAPFFFSTLRDIDLCHKASRQKNQYRFFYPSAINSLHILMESGLTLDRSLRMVAHVSALDSAPDNPVSSALSQSAILLESGYDGVMAVSALAERCPLPEIQAALRLMARYEREGGIEILELIRMQSDRGRQLYRDALRGKAEQRSLLFVIPMAIDLVVVMATVILPAVIGMRFNF